MALSPENNLNHSDFHEDSSRMPNMAHRLLGMTFFQGIRFNHLNFPKEDFQLANMSCGILVIAPLLDIRPIRHH